MSGNPASGTFSPDDLPEAFANHFSLGQVAEMAARLEDARLVMEADQPPARPTPGSGPQRLWLAGGRAARESWSFGRYELPPGPTSRRLARQEQDAAKAKARAEAEPRRSSLRRLPARRRRSTTLGSPRPLWKR